MKYCSTRGKDRGLSFEDVLFAGYSSDGGLYMPESIPQLSPEEIKSWSSLTYTDIVYKIARLFISSDEIRDQTLQNVLASAYNKFEKEELYLVDATSKTTAQKSSEPLWILELFHGPTFAFKDLALSFVSSLMEFYLTKQERHVIILVGTSGDTGGAAISAIEGRSNMDLIVLLPRHRCSEPQLLQMTTSPHDNITVYSVDGTADDFDGPIKRCFDSSDFVGKHNLMSINSINWGRILGQIAHFFYAYYQIIGDDLGKTLEVVIPTGAAGNITSGCIAQAMGLQIQFTAAVNTNDIVARTIRTGDFSKEEDIRSSLSSAMDIQVPYNVERMLFLFSGLSFSKVKDMMGNFEEKGGITVPDDIMKKMNQVVTGACINGDKKTLDVMRKLYYDHEYLLCPHTAVAVCHHFDSPPHPSKPRVYVASASPIKFPEAIKLALSCEGEKQQQENVAEIIASLTRPMDYLRSRPKVDLKMEKGEDWEGILREKIVAISSKWGK